MRQSRLRDVARQRVAVAVIEVADLLTIIVLFFYLEARPGEQIARKFFDSVANGLGGAREAPVL